MMEYIRFKDVTLSTQYGYTADETSKKEGTYKYLRITDIVPYFVNFNTVPFCTIPPSKVEQYLVNEGDILIARTGATTGYNYVVQKGVKNTVYASYLIRFNVDKTKVLPSYMKYVLKSNYYYGFINNYIGGSAQPGMNARVFGRFNIPNNSLPIQRRIASILSAYDNLIENNNKRIRLLERMAENLYKEWFVRFRFPGHEKAELENGLPKGWVVKRMSDFCDVTDGTHDTPKPVDDGVPLITGKCVSNGFIDYNEAYSISLDDHEKIKKRSGLSTGDILFSNIGTVGNCCIVDYDREFSVKNVIIFKPSDILKTAYLYYWMMSDSMQNVFSTQTNGASQQFVGLTFMRRYKILVPKQEVLSSFGERINPIIEQKKYLHRINQTLSRQRDLLLPRLMSGKLEVNI